MAREPVCYAEVAVPLPLPAPLTYSVPPAFVPLAVPGARARVEVGRRRVVGVIAGLRDQPPAGVEVRDLLEVVDRGPVLPAELLALAAFVADYYLAPPGEVLRAILPTDLAPWGIRSAWVTDAGALAQPKDAVEAAIVEALREGVRLSVAELQGRVGSPDFPRTLDRLQQEGKVAVAEARERGTRYRAAVELPPGDLERQLAASGRSPAGRQVVEYLAAVGRPATVAEVTAAVGCGAGVVRRLIERGVLRSFTQAERLSLRRHVLGARQAAPRIVLRDDQQAAAGALVEALHVGGFAPFALSGITGSGKTEVYLRALEACVTGGRGAILLVPEIALVPSLAHAVEARIGERPAILHSTLSAAERHQEWERVRGGQARVVLGARSAVFAPVPNLGLIAVDEEQDPAYKQDSTPRYHARDVALVRGRREGAAVVLVSATPSLETRWNAQRGRLRPLVLTSRVGQGRLPEGILVDLRQEAEPLAVGGARFSRRLREEIDAALAAGDQIILLRNRRGYAPLFLCRACGEDMRCTECGVPRTYHKRGARLLCHYCGSSRPAPDRCPACGEATLEPVGAGTERVEEEFQRLYPGVAAAVLDRDAVRRPGAAAAVIERFTRGETRVLVGTQMVSKGHHFPQVALTAVLAADAYLGFPDFRAVERTYSLLTQLAGRAGRGERPGRVVIQTYHPEHYAIQAALSHDDQRFEEEELRFRRIFHYPPYTRLVQLLVQDRNRSSGEVAIARIAEGLATHPLARGVRISGPAPAPLERLRGRWRFQLLLRGPSSRQLRGLLTAVLPGLPTREVTLDVDPHDLM